MGGWLDGGWVVGKARNKKSSVSGRKDTFFIFRFVDLKATAAQFPKKSSQTQAAFQKKQAWFDMFTHSGLKLNMGTKMKKHFLEILYHGDRHHC